MIAAIIPARGGSKRLPRKNLRLFSGRPLIHYSIALARAIDRFDTCVVSTEDAEIAEVARGYGADIIKRPAELADDHATTSSVVVHALETMGCDGRMPDAFVLLQPNCPLRPRSLVLGALDLLAEGACDSVVSVTKEHHKVGEIAHGLFVPHYEPGTRAQDMAERYFENGLVYAAWSRRVLETGSVFGHRARPLMTDAIYALGDIDTALDLEVAEHLFLKYRTHFDWVPGATHAAHAGSSL